MALFNVRESDVVHNQSLKTIIISGIRLLVNILQAYANKSSNAEFLTYMSDNVSSFQAWRQTYLAFDSEQDAKVSAEEAKALLIASALAKLSTEEKAALGL